ncbi:MAG TPA: radical SAM family heme chaperone HemW [Gammaproteobacteria bacterium]
MRFATLPPLSLYVHLPWCLRKCPYCDFNSYEARGAVPEDAYVDALLRDLHAELPFAQGRALCSIFLGGGTPSLFSGDAIRRLLAGIRARLPLHADTEITLEANPGAAEAERFAAYREAGVNRLSIGVQSFRDAQLEALGRVHSAAEAVRAVELARRAGFDEVNLDLMYGLPGDDPEAALADLETAAALEPTHLSWYELTLEPGTAFHRRPPPRPDEDVVLEIESRGRERLAARGFGRYEVSAYARPGHRCVHNLNYWQFGDYLGIGAGAHGKLTLGAEASRELGGSQAIVRRAKTRNPRTFMQTAGSPAAVTVERIEEPRQAVLEFMMNALRLPDGVDADCFEQRTGQPLAAVEQPLAEAERRGWLRLEQRRVTPTAEGLRALNRVLQLF